MTVALGELLLAQLNKGARLWKNVHSFGWY